MTYRQLKVFGEGEWKVRKHGHEKRGGWRKLHLAVDPVTHDIGAAEVSLADLGNNTAAVAARATKWESGRPVIPASPAVEQA